VKAGNLCSDHQFEGAGASCSADLVPLPFSDQTIASMFISMGMGVLHVVIFVFKPRSETAKKMSLAVALSAVGVTSCCLLLFSIARFAFEFEPHLIREGFCETFCGITPEDKLSTECSINHGNNYDPASTGKGRGYSSADLRLATWASFQGIAGYSLHIALAFIYKRVDTKQAARVLPSALPVVAMDPMTRT
jgi:hypothetical protein